MKPSNYLNRPVYSLQTMLRQISYENSNVLPNIPNGIYGKSTEASVKSFQQCYHLPVTGITDAKTWETIAREHSLIIPALLPLQAPLRSSPDLILKLGQRNEHIRLVQAMLITLSGYFKELKAPEISAVLDPVTAADLQWLQAAAGCQDTGNLDTNTWNILTRLYRAATADGVQPQNCGQQNVSLY